MIWKVNVFNSRISEKFFNQTFLDIGMIYQETRYMHWFIYHLDMVCEISKSLFFDILRYHNWSSQI